MKQFVLISCAVLALGACSLNKLVINKVSDALTGDGAGTVFTGDDDPILVGDAVPFAIKLYETLLDKNPNHPGLIVTTGSLFIMYANAFVQGPAEMISQDQWEERRSQLDRARKLYLRGAAILERGIKNKFPRMLDEWGPGDSAAFTNALSRMRKEDIPLFYWYAAGTLSAYALNIFDISLGLRVPRLTAMMQRAYELDEHYNGSALDEFFLILYSALPEGMGGDPEKALVHYQRALEKSKGNSTGPYLSYAQSIAVKNQDYESFKSNLEKALAIDPASDPSNTLVTVINQRKARYLLENAPEFFAEIENWDYNDE